MAVNGPPAARRATKPPPQEQPPTEGVKMPQNPDSGGTAETMIEHQYQPPEREYQDTLTTFAAWQLASAWSVQIQDDPHGPVNKIITLARYGKPVKTILYPLQPDDEIALVRDPGSTWADGPGWRSLSGLGKDPEPEPYRPPSWRVEVDGKTIMSITDTQIAALTPAPKPAPRKPLHTRLRRALTEQTRKDLDAVAKHLGYHRDEHCTGWD